MRLATTCPHCLTHYQVDPALRGQRMRCPNTDCRAVFVVREDEAAPAQQPEPPMPPATSPPVQQIVGSVGELVPVLPVEPVEVESPPAETAPPALSEETPAFLLVERPGESGDLVPLLPAEPAEPKGPAPEEIVSWQQPPPVRSPIPPPAEPAPSPPPKPKKPAMPSPTGERGKRLAPSKPVPADKEAMPTPTGQGPVELSWSAQPPPPSRTTSGAGANVAGVSPTPPQLAAGRGFADSAPAKPVSAASVRRRVRRLAAAVFLVLVAAGIGLYFLVQREQSVKEEDRYQQALAALKDKNYVDAAQWFRELERDYKDSPRRPTYTCLAELSEALEPVFHLQASAEEARHNLEQLEEFVERHRGDALLKGEQETALWRGFYHLAEPLPALAAEKHERAYLDVARRALGDAAKLQAPTEVHARAKLAEVETALAKANREIARWEQKQRLLADLHRLLKQPRGNVYRQGKTLVASTRPDLLKDVEFQALLRQLAEAHRQQVKYVAVRRSVPVLHPDARSDEPASIVVVNPVGAGGRKPGEHQSVNAGRSPILALVRGVLYGLDPDNGRLRWARRIGVDSTSLPVRLPATKTSAERLLVLSEDGKALRALDAASGTPLWRHDLAAPCPGRPVVVGDRALVPMLTGRVDEVETASGRLLGYYELGEPLLGEGAVQPGTKLLYLPADSFSIYVLDLAAHTCSAILYTEHLSGSLRGAPVVVSEPEQGTGRGKRAQKEGPKAGFLILAQADTLETTSLRIFKLPIREPTQQPLPHAPPPLPGWSWSQPFHDPEKLALTTDAGILAVYGIPQPSDHDHNLFPLAPVVSMGEGTPNGERSLLALVDDGCYWALLRGGLQKWQTGFFRKNGPRLVPRWPEPIQLGPPLHAAQAQRDKEKGTILFLVTQSPTGGACLASALEARSGRILWQEQLGLLCDRPPVVLGKSILALDRSGLLYQFEPGKEKAVSPGLALAGRCLGPVGGPQVLLFEGGPDRAVYTLAGTNRGEPATFVLRRWSLEQREEIKGLTTLTRQLTITLPAPVAGTLALGPDCLIVPLASGVLARQPLTSGEAISGPNWRSEHADEDVPGYVVWAGGQDYLVTDGGRTLRRFTWTADGNADERAAVELDRRIVAPPAILQRGKDGIGLLACIADAEGTLTLLQGPELAVIRRWHLGGDITAGPFARAGRIGCVRNRRELIWLDPAQKKPAWKYRASADIVGPPPLTPAGVLVAGLDGSFVALDPQTGEARGPELTLQANVAPSTAPAPWRAGLLLVPLTDGTLLLLPEDRFGKE
jgi:hypothetical protein